MLFKANQRPVYRKSRRFLNDISNRSVGPWFWISAHELKRIASVTPTTEISPCSSDLANIQPRTTFVHARAADSISAMESSSPGQEWCTLSKNYYGGPMCHKPRHGYSLFCTRFRPSRPLVADGETLQKG
jgi:hypothetical protein